MLAIPLKDKLAAARALIPPVGDIIPPGDIPSPWPEPKPEPVPILTQILSFFKILSVDFIVNGIVLGIGYLVLRRKDLIKSWKFLRYLLFVTIGGALIDLIYVGGQSLGGLIWEQTHSDIEFIATVFLGSVLLTSLGLFVYNYWLSRRFFDLTRRQAIFIGLIVGIFTNPFLATIATGIVAL